ncbi:WD repeat-containing protein, putative [Plasmodium vinckei brucechwatti]|uniref:WD repeat-containing protein, putative n=1 Tax=Plasmodium vinckei brucechwatti TaxID=119398 RepID=A0A6V7T1G0_PLAVN|nr:WD repeat-containing protein, putative [Plasmodium vinckei brucechwatti]
MEEGLGTIKKIKNNISKIYFNKSNKKNGDFKDDHIEIILDNKNITPKPIYFNFQEIETKKSFDRIDQLLKHFDTKPDHDDQRKNLGISNEEDPSKNIKNTNLNALENTHLHKDTNRTNYSEYEQYEKEILNFYDEILLTETETINLLNIPNILNDSEEDKMQAQKTNERYEKLLSNDESNCVNKSMQTLNVFKKNKDVYVSIINKQNNYSQTNLYELHKLTMRNSSNIPELLHKKFIKYRNKKFKKIMDEYGDFLSINERIILKKNMWVQVVDKNVVDNKQTTIIPKSFYKSKKTNTSLFNALFSSKNTSRSLSNKSRTYRSKGKFKNMKTMKFLTSSFSEDEYLIKSIIKKKKEQGDDQEGQENNIEDDDNNLPWKINNKKKMLNKENFILLLKTLEKCIIQNIYYYEQMLYKNIHLSYIKDFRKNNSIKMFDGENYDVLTNPNINYKKKKTIIRTKIKKNIKKIINFYQINKYIDTVENLKIPTKCDTSNANINTIVNPIKKKLHSLPKGKKGIISKRIIANKLRLKIRNKARKRTEQIKDKDKIIDDSSINDDYKLQNKGINNQKPDEENTDSLLKKNANDDKTNQWDQEILSIIINHDNNEDKLKKISTLIADDVFKDNNTGVNTISNDETKNDQNFEKPKNYEKKKLSHILKKKKKFMSINGNRIKIKSEVKQNDCIYNNMSDNDDMEINISCLESTYKKENIEAQYKNNTLYNCKRKEYIKNISIDKLFQFHYKNLEKNVTSIDTNKFYEDYITASYSNTLDIGNFQNSKGNIAIFSFINPTYPIKLYNLNTSVMKIKYSNNNPSILVAALCNGHINIYDIRNNDNNPVLKSTMIKNYDNCFEPIYDISFKNSYTSNSINECVFYSAHENGSVYQWDIQKELNNKEILYLKNKKNHLYTDLSSIFQNKGLASKPFNSSLRCIDIDNYMQHDEDFIISNIEKKKSANNFHKNEKNYNEYSPNNSNINDNNDDNTNNEEIDLLNKNSHDLNGTEKYKDVEDLDFVKSISKEEELSNHYKNITKNIIDKTIKPIHSYYYVGTKNGIIYRCNSCYHKSFLNYYYAHFGSVNRIKINQFDHDIFLSAGEDSTVKLWNKFSNKQITTFKSKNSYSSINDILWLPNNSTSFFCCSDDGRVELWDFDFLSKDPLVIFYPNVMESSKMISLEMFNKNDILLCGDNLSNVFMIKIKNLVDREYDNYEQKAKLANCLKHLDTYDYF